MENIIINPDLISSDFLLNQGLDPFSVGSGLTEIGSAVEQELVPAVESFPIVLEQQATNINLDPCNNFLPSSNDSLIGQNSQSATLGRDNSDLLMEGFADEAPPQEIIFVDPGVENYSGSHWDEVQ